MLEQSPRLKSHPCGLQALESMQQSAASLASSLCPLPHPQHRLRSSPLPTALRLSLLASLDTEPRTVKKTECGHRVDIILTVRNPCGFEQRQTQR